MTTPEFSRPIRVDQLARHGQGTITADEAERAALAQRFHLLGLDLLEADYQLGEESGAITATGRVRAQLAQACVATGVPVPERIDAPLRLRFVQESADPAEEEELDMETEDFDIIGYDGQVIDLGEAVAETMALVMTPYPRSPDADRHLRDAGVLTEEQASPFAALLSLKDDEKAKKKS